ncbi:hypothetical protein L6164_020136 [Bauhinia variegata]|uniref:Uncharacterized protein n=1 Tax=Bauhinia variegata TaxID=167791 RepID=A0ACB9MVG1_BAUVA|nr:hypothetical protein L6164_020136 [Bauhinia variegata]
MRTRNSDSSKSATVKKTPPARKSATKTPTTPSNLAGESATPKSADTKRTAATKTRQVKKNELSLKSSTTADSKTELSSDTVAEEAKPSPGGSVTKVATTTKSAVKRTPGRTRTPTRAGSTPKPAEQVEIGADETPKVDNFKAAEKDEEPQNVEVANAGVIESEKEGEQDNEVLGQPAEKEQKPIEVDEPVLENVCESVEKEKDIVEIEICTSHDSYNSLELEKPTIMELAKPAEDEDSAGAKVAEKAQEEEGEKAKKESKEEETNNIGDKEACNTEFISIEEKDQLKKGDGKPETGNIGDDEGLQGCNEKLDLGEQGDEDLIEDYSEETPEETETWEEERRELTAIAKERKIKKEHEIFVGGLDRDATEEDLRKVFERIGEVVEVRLHKNGSTNKNKGYAFVKFADKEHAKKALSEMKNPVIHGKRCGTAPSEDNDTLFLGNICNTWTKEAIKQKLKDYGVEGVEKITLVSDVQHEGLSRGFAFLEFSCHADAMMAYKRLQKPDVIFGHAERTAKVAFAEPLREPDPEVMAQVKSVFVDGLPPHWDEDRVREQFKGFGEIVRIVLARNMSTAKRKDFGFVDFATHEAAVACVDGVNTSELDDGASKMKVRARLSNPLPKTQAVKGGMCGGFRIGHASTGGFPRFGRGFGRGGHSSNWGNFSRDRNNYHGGRSQIGRMSFRNAFDFNNAHPDFHQRQYDPRGERRGPLRGGHYAGGRGAAIAGPPGPYYDRAWYGAPERGPAEPILSRRPYSPEGQYGRPSMGRHFDDPYLYEDNAHGVKRPFYMTDPDPDYMGPSRFRPRLDYTDPALFRHGSQYHDSFGAGSRQYPHDYYGPDYGGGPYSSFYGGNSSYGRGYYY